MEDVKIGTYIHYKGGEYRVHAVGKIHSTDEDVVIYQDKDDAWWVREKEEFLGNVEVNGEFVPRFRYLGDE